MKKKIYLAGAMGCYTDCPQKATQWREDVSKIIWERGCENKWSIFDPTKHYNYWNPSHITEKEIMRYEFNVLSRCDCVLVDLKNLEKSIGTSDEILLSYLRGIPVIGFYEGADNIDSIHPWKVEQIDRIETGKDALQNAIDYILNYYS